MFVLMVPLKKLSVIVFFIRRKCCSTTKNVRTKPSWHGLSNDGSGEDIIVLKYIRKSGQNVNNTDQRFLNRASFRTHDPHYKTNRGQNPGQNSRLIRYLPYIRNPRIRSIYCKSSVHNPSASVDRWTYSPPHRAWVARGVQKRGRRENKRRWRAGCHVSYGDRQDLFMTLKHKTISKKSYRCRTLSMIMIPGMICSNTMLSLI